MNISVIPTAQQAQDINFSGQTVVVIDVLRATSVITTALDNGAREVIPVRTVEEAESLFVTCNASMTLRGGERNALKIEGFDLSNSPLEYKKKMVEGKTVILTTTNGTNAINNIIGADEVILACFRNVAAVVEHVLERLPRCDSPTSLDVGLRQPQCDHRLCWHRRPSFLGRWPLRRNDYRTDETANRSRIGRFGIAAEPIL